MKELVKRFHSYLAFDGPVQLGNIRSEFATIYDQQCKMVPGWGADSTRQKLIHAYWFTDVVGHFAAMYGLSVGVVLLFIHHFDKYTFLAFLSVGVYSFLILLFFHYLPNFTFYFLPNLDAVRNTFEVKQQQKIIQQLQEQLAEQHEQNTRQQHAYQKELQDQYINQQQLFQIELQRELAEQETRLMKHQERTQRHFHDRVSGQKVLIGQQQMEARKCRKMQWPSLTLTLIYYTLVKLSGINTVIGNAQTAHLLQKLFGVTGGNLGENLKLIAGNSSKREGIGQNKRTRMHDRFEEAIEFFEEIDCPQGISVLEGLKIKMLSK
jgi:hypothetical protein